MAGYITFIIRRLGQNITRGYYVNVYRIGFDAKYTFKLQFVNHKQGFNYKVFSI